MGEVFEEPFVRALALKQAEGQRVYLVPLTPSQSELALRLGVETRRGFPDYMFLEVDHELDEDVFSLGGAVSPLLARLYERGAERTIVIERKKYPTVSVEYATSLREEIEPIISLYGEIVARRRSPLGTTVIDIVPFLDDPIEVRSILKDQPGVLEVGVFPLEPYRRIVLR